LSDCLRFYVGNVTAGSRLWNCQTDILFFKNNEFDRIGIRFFVVFSILFSLFIHLPNNPENTADIIYIFCYEIPSWALIFYYIFDTIYDIV
jgi:hypothetical protein